MNYETYFLTIALVALIATMGLKLSQPVFAPLPDTDRERYEKLLKQSDEIIKLKEVALGKYHEITEDQRKTIEYKTESIELLKGEILRIQGSSPFETP